MRRSEKKRNDLPLIKPMEPVSIEEIPENMDYFAQVKWDGIRILANVAEDDIQLYTRNMQLRTWTYPEIVMELRAQFSGRQILLDGECVSWKEDKPDFFQVLRRDRMKNLEKIQRMTKEIPVVYMVFDLLFLDGEWMLDHPFSRRMERLQSLLISTPLVQLCTSTEDGVRLLRYVKKKQWEGIVLKEKNSAYHEGRKSQAWKKLKLKQVMEAFVLGVTFRAKKVNALILGRMEDDTWHYIGKVSSGLTQEEIELITNWVASVKVDQLPAISVQMKQPVVWVPPHLKVTIEFSEWTPSGTLRSPVIKGYSFQI